MNLDSFTIIGLSVYTTNENGKSAQDLGDLWTRFCKEDVAARIHNKKSDDVYCAYTDYESDYRGAYTAMVGLSVHSLEDVPHGLVGREFEGGAYKKFETRGPMPNALISLWQDIWRQDVTLKRRYSADFEVHKAQDPRQYPKQNKDEEGSYVAVYVAVD